MQIAGTCAQHAIITDACRRNRGDWPAFEEAVRRLRDEYQRIIEGWSIGQGAQIHIAITVERPSPIIPDWNGISADDRRLWFGVAVKGMEAPWMNGFGACLVKIWDIRRRADGVVEYGIGNEVEPKPEDIGWVTGDKFFDEWPQ